MPPASIAFHWFSHAATHAGLVRSNNEDAVLERPDVGLWAVADGMGGHSDGALASRALVERLARVDRPERLSEYVTAVESAVLEVNAHLRLLGHRAIQRTIGSTLAVLLLHGGHAVCMWAGDSRVYRLRGPTLDQLSQDHALVEDLVERGFLDRAKAQNHPQSNLVTRAVGASDDLKLDLDIFELSAGDVFLLCSDGLDKEASPGELAEVMMGRGRSTEPRATCLDLIALALERGGRDNVSVIAIQVEVPGQAPAGQEDHAG